MLWEFKKITYDKLSAFRVVHSSDHNFYAYLKVEMVGPTGFEPATPSPPAKCATKLRHGPTV